MNKLKNLLINNQKCGVSTVKTGKKNMRKFLLLALSVFAIGPSFAQTASDYYLPFCVGNQTVLEIPGSMDHWGKTVTFTYIQADSINNDLCYLQEGKLYLYSGCCPLEVFHLIWLTKDMNGDIYLKAYSEEYPTLDSAEILPTPILYFSHNYLTPGYSITQTVEPGHDVKDSVISTNATWDYFTNCIQIRETDIVNDTITNIGDAYYAYGIGKVGEQSIYNYPPDDLTSSTLVSAFVTSCEPLIDTIPANVVDACLGDYFDYYINNIQVDTANNTVTVTWVFQDSTIANEFVQTYNYQYQGNNIISITIQCNGKKTSETFYKPIYISSSPLGINESVNTNLLINIYPNPAKDNLLINLDNPENEEFSLTIYNAIGAIVKSEKLNQNEHQIFIGDLSGGIYIIEIKSKDLTEKQKLIIQR